ncbi:integration host factor subunit beta [Candidatus Dependentiae bacterium]|nr:integration host factor subunit beta [Candidatus Dependentiae bacterium]
MTRAELIDKLAIMQPHLLHQDIEKATKCIIEYMAQSLAKGQRVEIRGFGSFAMRYQPPRATRNPKTGAAVGSPAKHTIYFRTGKELKDRVNQNFLDGKPIKNTEK